MSPTTFTLALDAMDPAADPALPRLRAARARVWSAITARWRKSLDPGVRASFGSFTVDGDASRITVQWDATPDAPDPRPHALALAVQMEAAAIARVLAPLRLRPCVVRVGLDAIEPPATACGLCRAAWADPLRWIDLPTAARDSLLALTPEAMRADPAASVATLSANLAASDAAIAIAAAHVLARLARACRAAERATLADLVVTAWRHPDARVARVALRGARSFKSRPSIVVLDAWVAAIGRFGDDADAIADLAPLAGVAARTRSFAAALPAWLRSRAPAARRLACERLSEVLGDAPSRWTPAQTEAFQIFVAVAEAEIAVEHVPLLLRHIDALDAGARAALHAWLDAADSPLADVAHDLFAQQPSHPALDAACLRVLQQPSPDLYAHGFATRGWSALDDAQHARAVDLLLEAMARTDGTPVGEGIRKSLDMMVCDAVHLPRPATARLAAALLAPGTSAARVGATAERFIGWWPQGLRDEKHRVVRAFVQSGHTDVLVDAFRDFAKRRARDDGGDRVARVGLGLSWSMQHAGAWAEGGAVAGLAAAVAPPASQPNLRYNEACGFAMTHDAEGAARSLAAAIALDPKQRDDARGDRDFDGVRTHPAMRALLG